MKPEETCAHVRENLWRYIDRELTAPALAEISAHLKACGECSRLYDSRARDAKLYRMAFVGSPFGEDFVERFHKRTEGLAPLLSTSPGEALEGTAESTDGLLALPARRRLQDRLSRRRGEGLRRYLPEGARTSPRRFFGRIALAAALLLIGSLVLLGLWPGRTLGIIDAQGRVVMLRGERTLPAVDRDFRAGDGFRLLGGSRLRLVLHDGSDLALSGPAEFLVERASEARGPFLGRLEAGLLRASVEHRGAGRELRLLSPDATALVVGTRFTLLVERGQRTVLEVEEGEVRLKGRLAPDSVAVNPRTGPYQVLAAQGRPQPLSPPAADEASPPPPEPPAPPAAVGEERGPAPGAVEQKPTAPAPVTDLPVTDRPPR